ncbi:MAG: chemotaxis protein CheA [Spirochaetia bacterium]
MIDKFKEAFKDEAYELLNQLEGNLLELESQPDNPDLISAVFRSMHTIKGSSAMFGYNEISQFTHEIESMLDHVRNGEIPITQEIIDITLKARDHIRVLLEASPEDDFQEITDAILSECRKVLDALHAEEDYVPGPEETALEENMQDKLAPNSEKAKEEQHTRTFRIKFEPNEDLFLSGTNPLLLLKELEDLGEVTSICITDRIPPLDKINPEKCYLAWEIILTTEADENAVKDVFIFIDSNSKLDIQIIDEEDVFTEEVEYKKLGQILVEKGVIQKEEIEAALHSQKKLGEVLVENKNVPKSALKSALKEQEHVRKHREQRQNDYTTSSIRVSSDKLDSLIDLVGELVTIQARLSQTVAKDEDSELNSVSEQIERLTSQLRDNAMSIRMLPIGSTFSKFRRLVRDLSRDLNKEIEMVTEGAETELDKTVIERLNDPLVHLIRNSIDHGIETPEARKAVGKSEKGTVTLSASHAGASVIIDIEDDGKGLDSEQIRKKAVSRGIISEEQHLSEQDIYQLIFAPGFSTAQNVTNVSGRGVGMDVVKKEIESLGGIVTIKSASGKGTKISLKLPLTLAIIEGLLVKIQEDYFIVPLSSVDRCIEHQGTQQKNVLREITELDGHTLPYLRLRKLFNIEGTPPDIEQIVVINSGDNYIGIVVDEVIGDYQTVIKSLGRVYRGVEGVSGATILGDGTVALILDVNKIPVIANRELQKSK